jgi:NAD(P)-dependent dehydrogenase (short-subunit alcohol dehydrogenase family)
MMEHILITGAAGGLGKKVTERFLENGYRVSALISKNGEPDFIKHEQLHVYQADLMDEEDARTVIQKAVDAAPGIEAGILLVGGFAMGPIQKTSLKEIEKMYRLNFVTAYNTARSLLEIMESQESGGQIIFIGARPVLDPEAARQMVAYTLSKSLIFKLAEVINAEGEKKGITASVVVPSIIDTPANRRAMPEADFSRWVTTEDIADNLLHLLTPAGRKLRKTVFRVYGDS